MIKAIETRYKGYRFRSRLEARWAVFFDALGVRWEYEPEGFDLGSNGWYLPDFLVGQVWIEIKPLTEKSGEFMPKLAALSLASYPVLYVSGAPRYGGHGISLYYNGELFTGDRVFHFGFMEHVKTGESIGLGIHGGGELCVPLQNRTAYDLFVSPSVIDMICDHPQVMQAYEKAISARFEHGETPC